MYTYGPVPSRRLGRSLGVSPIPAKSCSYSCVYCQLGRTNNLQIERESFFPKDKILEEIIRRAGEADFEYATFVGDGEPTLNADLGWLIEKTKERLDCRVAVITNGSLLWQEDVREDLMRADVVIPTLDAGNKRTFKGVNRPHRGIKYDSMIQGQIEFSREYDGQLWLEVMLVNDINDSDDELMSIKKAVDQINADRVYVLTPIRPPAESWVKPSEPERIVRAQKIIGKAIAVSDRESGEFGLNEFSNSREAILEIGSRHPLRRDQAIDIEIAFGEDGIIENMIIKGDLIPMQFGGESYLLPGHFRMDRSKNK